MFAPRFFSFFLDALDSIRLMNPKLFPKGFLIAFQAYLVSRLILLLLLVPLSIALVPRYPLPPFSFSASSYHCSRTPPLRSP